MLNVSPTATAGTVTVLDKIDNGGDDKDDSDGLSGGAIFGIIAGALVFIILIVLLTCYLVKKNRASKTENATKQYGNVNATDSEALTATDNADSIMGGDRD